MMMKLKTASHSWKTERNEREREKMKKNIWSVLMARTVCIRVIKMWLWKNFHSFCWKTVWICLNCVADDAAFIDETAEIEPKDIRIFSIVLFSVTYQEICANSAHFVFF